MQIGVVIQTPDTRPQVIAFFLGQYHFYGPPKDNPLYLVQAQWKNTGRLQTWLQKLVRLESCFWNCIVYYPLKKITLIYCDNVGVLYLSGNPVQHHQTKHVQLDIHLIREKEL